MTEKKSIHEQFLQKASKEAKAEVSEQPKTEGDSKEALLSRIAELEKKVKNNEVEKAQLAGGVFGQESGYILAKIEPRHVVHQRHWDKGSIFPAVKVNMGDLPSLIVFTAKLDGGKDSGNYRFNNTKKSFQRLFEWCATLEEAEALKADMFKRKIN